MKGKGEFGRTGIYPGTSGAKHQRVGELTPIPTAGTYTEQRQTYGVSEHLPKLPPIQVPFFTDISKEWYLEPW